MNARSSGRTPFLSFRAFVLSWLIPALGPFALANIACARSPNDAFARTVEQAASWAAAADFAVAMHQSGRVPQAYLDDLLRKGAEDLAALQSKLSSDDDIAASARSRASVLCDRLASAFRDSAGHGDRPKIGDIRNTGAELRALASAVRTGAVEKTAGESR